MFMLYVVATIVKIKNVGKQLVTRLFHSHPCDYIDVAIHKKLLHFPSSFL